MRQADPGAFIFGPAESGYDVPWTQQMTEDGLLPSLDAFSLHPYRGSAPDTARADFRTLRQWLAAHPVRGQPLPVVSSEWGYSTVSVSQDQQADYLARMFLGNLQSEVDLSIWYDWSDDCQRGSNPECHFGLVRVDNGTISPKPAYTAARTLTHVLSGYRYSPATDGDACPSGLHAVRLTKGEAAAEAVWTTGATTLAPLYVGGSTVTLISQEGSRTEAQAPGGILRQLAYRQSVTYVLVGPGHMDPPPTPGELHTFSLQDYVHLTLSGSAGQSEAAAIGAAAAANGPVLVWKGVCGVHAYQILASDRRGGGPLGLLWHRVAEVRTSYWAVPASEHWTYYAVAAVGPTGLRSARTASVRLGVAAGSP